MTRRKPRKNNNRHKKKWPAFTHRKFWLRFAHHEHSGKRLPFHATSYAALFFLLAFTCSLLLFVGQAARAYENIQSGDISLAGFSKGPPPANPAEITSPLYKNVFDESGVTIRGTCEPDKFIELHRNNVLAGGAICDQSGAFELFITLLPGKNVIFTRIHDALFQYGPNSTPVTLWYDVPEQIKPPLLIKTRAIQNGLFVNQTLQLTYSIAGGNKPYSVYVDWGDGGIPELANVLNAGTHNLSHTYEDTGQYVITIKGIDANNNQYTLQSVIVVHSDKSEAAITGVGDCRGTDCSAAGLAVVRLLNWAWPALVVAILMTASFWVGEKVAYSHVKTPKHA